VQLVPEDIWQNYLLRFEAEEGCGFQECEVEDTEHFHCKDEGCETVFRYRAFFSRMRSSNLGENCEFQAKLKRALSGLISLYKRPFLPRCNLLMPLYISIFHIRIIRYTMFNSTIVQYYTMIHNVNIYNLYMLQSTIFNYSLP
jgi:hypothetical protein